MGFFQKLRAKVNSICGKFFAASSSSPDSVLDSQLKQTGESVDYLGKEKVVVVTRLSPHVMAELERKFPMPIVVNTSTPMEVAQALAYQRIFKELRDGFVTE